MALTNRKFTVEIRGRKRKAGPRHGCGKLIQDRPADPNVIALRMPHRASVPADVAHDAKAECALGRYQLNKIISQPEYEAGIWYRGVVEQYRILICGPSPFMTSMGGERTIKGASSEMDEEEAKHRKDRYNGAFAAAERGGEQRGAKAVARVAVYDEPCPDGLMGYMRRSLVALAVHKGVCSNRERLDFLAEIRNRYFRNIG